MFGMKIESIKLIMKKISTNEKNIEELKKKDTGLQSGINTLTNKLKQDESLISANKNSIVDLSKKQSECSTQALENKKNISSLSTKVSANEGNIKTIDTRSKGNASNIGTLQNDVKALKSRVVYSKTQPAATNGTIWLKPI